MQIKEFRIYQMGGGGVVIFIQKLNYAVVAHSLAPPPPHERVLDTFDRAYIVFVFQFLQHDNMSHFYMSLVPRKPVFGVSDQVRYKPSCTATEDTCSQRLEISD